MKSNTLVTCLSLALGVISFPVPQAQSCSRLVYFGLEDIVITARSMDWANDIHTDLWAFPRGMKRAGAAGPKSVEWTSQYGSVIAAGFDGATADGMNERGLVANLLYLAEAGYVKPTNNDPRKALAISAWAQYLLDNHATVAEAVTALRRDTLYVLPMMTPDGKPGTVHMAISDATGDSAIFEYVGGKLVIHHGRPYQVMCNSPVYDQQLALNKYWEQIGGAVMLPGTSRSADRFVRASFYVNSVKQTADIKEAVATAFSIIRNVSAPIGVTPDPDKPNIAQTLWRTVSDHKNRRYYFESTRTPNVFWVNLADMDFKPGASVKWLKLTDGAVFAGNTADKFVSAEPFRFLPAEVK